jgi:Zn-dependent oligopeptidase
MNSKQLRELIDQIEALKSANPSAEFQAGVDAAKALVQGIAQTAIDRERIQKLEAELAQLRSKYPEPAAATPKRRGRRPKSEQTLASSPEEMSANGTAATASAEAE